MRLNTLIIMVVLGCCATACKSSKNVADAPLWKQLILTPETTHKKWGGEAKCLHSSPFQYATPENLSRMMAVLNCYYTKADGARYKVVRSFFDNKKPILIELKLNTPQPMTGQTIASILGVDPGVSESFTSIWSAHHGHHPAALWRNLPAELTQQKIYRVDALPTKADATKTDHVMLYIESTPRVMKMMRAYHGDIRGVSQHGILPASAFGAGVDEPRSLVLNQSQLIMVDAFGSWETAPKELSSRSALVSALATRSLPESAQTKLSAQIKRSQRERAILQQTYEHKLLLATTRGEPMEVVAPLLHALSVATDHRVGLLTRLSKESHLGPVGVKYFYTYPTPHKEKRKTPDLFIDLTDNGIKLSHEVNVDGVMKSQVVSPVKGCVTKGQTICTSRQPTALRVLIDKAQVIDQGLKTFGSKEAQVANQWYQQVYDSYDWASLRKLLISIKAQHPNLRPIVRTAPNTPLGLTFHLIGQVARVDPNQPMREENVLFEVMHVGLIP